MVRQRWAVKGGVSLVLLILGALICIFWLIAKFDIIIHQEPGGTPPAVFSTPYWFAWSLAWLAFSHQC